MAEEKIEIVPGDTPWEVACKIINAEHETVDFLGQKTIRAVFDNDDLLCIGKHLVNYCEVERERE